MKRQNSIVLTAPNLTPEVWGNFEKNIMKENLFFGYLGNGLSVADRNKTANGDYKTIAHISENGTVKYYASVSIEAKKEIEAEAEAQKTKQLNINN